jgi:hypothetical protein
MPYIGFEPTASDTLSVFKYVATGSQTTFTGADAGGATLSYDVGDGSCQVWLNGVRLDSSDITATNGTSVVLAACTAGDIVHIQATKAFLPSDAVSASAGGTFASAVTMTSPLAVASGGTGAATHTANGVLLGAGTGAVTTAAPGSSGNVLTSNGTVWASAAAPATDLTAVADGSVGSPSIANSGDTNTGIYWPGADQLGLTTAGAAGLLIDASGRVTTPLQTMFRTQVTNYAANVTGDGTTYIVDFDSELGDVGGHFNTTTHTFTAPIAGYYLFSVVVPYRGITSSETAANTDLIFSSTQNVTFSYLNPGVVHAGSYYFAAGTVVAPLAASETAHVTMRASGGSKVVDLDYAWNSHFAGFLIG